MEKEQSLLDTLTQTQLNTYQQLFSFFDKDDSGSIPMTSVAMYIRGMGHCPTEAEMGKILQEFGAPKAKTVTFYNLVSFLIKRPKEQMIEDQLVDAFYVFQSSITPSSKDLMQTNFLRKLLAEQGEPFNDSEIESFTQFINTNGLRVNEQEFNYRNFCKILAYAEMQN